MELVGADAHIGPEQKTVRKFLLSINISVLTPLEEPEPKYLWSG